MAGSIREVSVMQDDFVRNIVKIEEKANQIVAEAEADAKNVLKDVISKIEALKQQSKAEITAAVEEVRREFEERWKKEERTIREDFDRQNRAISKQGAAKLNEAASWVAKKLMEM